ncbi:phosphatase PAP2 family protein [Streptomyces agglomeratus]|uniref:Phosphatase PAP2 family protein n=1 Tax=Streptomyces agglomeratus TaxID=285458 RepID=A0A1E5P176_9ACTN|nr:phosphatase PAP2 family protein [Streptomyces agglomeratus]OEJ23262.1 phosphatase PAP2 family protein [Streptomyces agglomeratus]OEJ42836.1 phosphatase PAP2 family protein [Streptomyces agglomeratus]OEJ55234.1 phosphatase PAP2 family protein [Streptomyces agglomeratus]OEJ62605.1 phosphatase PAP2 family protein [Streptomyces agglomeratus]
MHLLHDLRRVDRQLTRRAASWDSPWVRQVLPAVESAAEKTKLWWGIAVVMAAAGGHRERRAAVAGVAGMLSAQVIGNAGCKQLYERRRPPADMIPHDDVEDRPDSSSFPSGHTAAAVGFTAAVAVVSPWWGTAAAVPAAMVAVERVHSGAHYPSDVAAGAVIGLASAWLVHRTPRLLLRKLL